MSKEIGQLDIADRQLIPTGAPPRKSLSREIGEAEVIHTFFGRAKVRVVRKEDEFRRNLWWTVLAVMLVIVAVQVWFIWQQEEAAGEDVQQTLLPEAASAPAVAEVQPVITLPPPVPLRPAAPVEQAVVAAPTGIVAQTTVRPVQPEVQAASAVAAPAPARRMVRPQPKPVVQTAASAPTATALTGATAETTQEVTPAPSSDPYPR